MRRRSTDSSSLRARINRSPQLEALESRQLMAVDVMGPAFDALGGDPADTYFAGSADPTEAPVPVDDPVPFDDPVPVDETEQYGPAPNSNPGGENENPDTTPDGPHTMGGTIELSSFGVLEIHGTEFADRIIIDQGPDPDGSGEKIFVSITDKDGNVIAFDKFRVEEVGVLNIFAGHGSDRVVNNTQFTAGMNGGTGDDTLIGGSARDVLEGNSGNDTLEGRGGDDILEGGMHNDTYVFAGDDDLGRDEIHDESGWGDVLDFSGMSKGVDVRLYKATDQTVNDLLTLEIRNNEFFDDIESVVGSDFNDKIFGNSSKNHLDGGAGNDTLAGRDWSDTLIGGEGDDDLYGEAGHDLLDGGAGRDHLFGGEKVDTLIGGTGNDTLAGGTGDDIYKFAGSEYLGMDRIDETSGSDTADFSEMGTGVDITLDRIGWQYINPLLYLYTDFAGDLDRAIGTDYNDRLIGGYGDNGLYGGLGNDFLDGGAGDDGLFGGEGDDTMIGGAGADRFLVMPNVDSNQVSDLTGEDIPFWFENGDAISIDTTIHNDPQEFGAGTWTVTDVAWVDAALAKLQDVTGNDTLLHDADGNRYRFIRRGSTSSSTGAWHSENGQLNFADPTFANGGHNIQRSVFHEVGHSWDAGNTPYWGSFLALSEWTDIEPTGADALLMRKATTQTQDLWYHWNAKFAREYGRSDPREDWSTAFAATMADRYGIAYTWDGYAGYGADNIPFKVNLMNNWLSSISTEEPQTEMDAPPVILDPGSGTSLPGGSLPGTNSPYGTTLPLAEPTGTMTYNVEQEAAAEPESTSYRQAMPTSPATDGSTTSDPDRSSTARESDESNRYEDAVDDIFAEFESLEMWN